MSDSHTITCADAVGPFRVVEPLAHAVAVEPRAAAQRTGPSGCGRAAGAGRPPPRMAADAA